MISVSLLKHLPNIEIKADFSFEGGCLALFGPSGVGKTTILSMIAGLVIPDSGKIFINDKILYDKDLKINLPPEKRRIGYVFQESRLFPHMTVLGNLNYGAGRENNIVSIEDIVVLLGIKPLLKRYPKNLSGGEKQRVALGRALLSVPEFLLMDEPMAALDSVLRRELINYVVKIKSTLNIPIIYVTHNKRELRDIADHVCIMDKGHIINFGKVSEVFENDTTKSSVSESS